MNSIWEDIKAQIKDEIPKNSFSLWINPISFLEKNDSTVLLSCPNKFSKDWLTENFSPLIKRKFQDRTSSRLDILFSVNQRREPRHPSTVSPTIEQMVLPNMAAKPKPFTMGFNQNYTFDRFIVGRSNEFAFSASNALANDFACSYQALLMLANTGLGKTHLSHAVGHAVLNQNPRSRVFYTTAEDFTNEMILALRNNRIEDFKNKYRKRCDVLLLEEVHFLSGKKKTQDELGYTLDALANDNKKIIFTSSLPPKDIPNMSKQLTSRLTSGLVTTIDDPDYETRTKILTKKASEYGLKLSGQIIHFLATRLKKDIRQMESALTCLKAKSDLLRIKIDMDLAREVATCLVSEEKTIQMNDIKDLVCKYYKIEPDTLHSKSRKKEHGYPRNIFVYLCRHHTPQTLEAIAKTVNRTHSTVLYAAELVEHKMKSDPKLRRQVQFLSQKVEEMRH